MSDHIVTALASVVSLAGIWLILFWLYRDYCVDRFRQELFALRDDLFDEAESGLVAFEHPAYGMLRSTMNGFIRFGHRLGLIQLIAGAVIVESDDYKRIYRRSFADRWERTELGR